MNYFVDTEFTGLKQNTQLISIGCISALGDSFYGEITDYESLGLSDWIIKNVIGNLKFHEKAFDTEISYTGDNEFWKVCGTKQTVAESFKNFLQKTRKAQDVEFVIDCGHYDFVLIIDLILQTLPFNQPKEAISLPEWIVPAYHEFNQDIANFYKIPLKEAFDLPREKLVTALDIDNHYSSFILLNQEKHNSYYDAVILSSLYELMNSRGEIID
jgi:hypothetical protein